MASKVITLEDGFRILDINCDLCGTHSQITHEDVFSHTCQCGREYFNLAYYEFDKDGVANFNKYYYEVKNNKIKNK